MAARRRDSHFPSDTEEDRPAKRQKHEHRSPAIPEPVTDITESASEPPAPALAPTATSAPMPCPADSSFSVRRIMSEDEDSSLLLKTVCTDRVPDYAAVGSEEFEAEAARWYGKDWRNEPEYRSAQGLRSATHMIQWQLILKRIEMMSEDDQRVQYAAVGINYETQTAKHGGDQIQYEMQEEDFF